MLIWTARVSKKTKAVVAVILAGILAAAVLLLVGRSGGGQDAAAWQLTGNADRIAYLESMGWQVEEEPVETDSRTHWSIRSRTEPVRNGLRAKKELPHCGSSFSWLKNQASVISVTAPEPTVRPPSRIAKRRPFSMAMGVISSTLISTLSPGMHISVPSGRVMTPVTSVVRK